MNSSMRGELDRAIQLAALASWFLNRPAAADAFYHALGALILSERSAEAAALIDAWRIRNPSVPPRLEQRVLQIEARVAADRCQFARERDALEECLALCEAPELRSHWFLAEADLAAARMRSGDLRGAARAVRAWPVKTQCATPVDAFRDLTRAEIALLLGRHDDAARAAARALQLFVAVGHAPLVCHLRFCLALCARAEDWPGALDEYRCAAAASRFPLYLRRLRLLERVTSASVCARSTTLLRRTRSQEARVPLIRIWVPEITSMGADLYWDRVQGHLYLRGEGPLSLAARPILERALEALVQSPDRSLPLADWFERVWGGSYHPLRHESKCHVAIHRLRRWLGEHAEGAEGLLVLSNGVVALRSDAEICVLDLPSAGEDARAREASLGARVTEALGASGPRSPAELERLFGVSRSSLHNALRPLVESKAIVRMGRGPATRYASTVSRRPLVHQPAR